MHPKLAHGTGLDGFDFLWLLVAFVHSLSHICKNMFTCASLGHGYSVIMWMRIHALV